MKWFAGSSSRRARRRCGFRRWWAGVGLRYFHPKLHGWVELVNRRTVHVSHSSGGRDKVILIYRYECQACGHTFTAAGLPNVRKQADRHFFADHSAYWSGRANLEGGSDVAGDTPPF